MECKHPYYQLSGGVLRCSVCNEPSDRESYVTEQRTSAGVIEDKLGPQPENKRIWPAESKRQSRVVKKGSRGKR
jgi:hypothetical protein